VEVGVMGGWEVFFRRRESRCSFLRSLTREVRVSGATSPMKRCGAGRVAPEAETGTGGWWFCVFCVTRTDEKMEKRGKKMRLAFFVCMQYTSGRDVISVSGCRSYMRHDPGVHKLPVTSVTRAETKQSGMMK